MYVYIYISPKPELGINRTDKQNFGFDYQNFENKTLLSHIIRTGFVPICNHFAVRLIDMDYLIIFFWLKKQLMPTSFLPTRSDFKLQIIIIKSNLPIP